MEIEPPQQWRHGWIDHISAMKAILTAVKRQRQGIRLWRGPKLSLGFGYGRNMRVVPTSAVLEKPSAKALRLERELESLHIAHVVSQILGVVAAPRFQWLPDSGEHSYRLALEPQTLVGALWLQAAMHISGQKEIRECAASGCGNIIESSRDGRSGRRVDARFCSDACRARMYRMRKSATKKDRFL
jgi:hypothetical protein